MHDLIMAETARSCY